MCTDLALHQCAETHAAPRAASRAVPASSARQGVDGLNRRTALFGAAGLAATTAFTSVPLPAAAAPAKPPRRHGKADLSYVLGENFPAYTQGEEAVRKPGTNIAANGYYRQRWELFEHTGTHVDAPSHFNANGRYVTELKLEELMMVPAVVIDITARAKRNPDAEVTVKDLRRHELRHGRIENRAAVLMSSGWGAKVSDADAYRGTDAEGLHFPGFSADATEWLIKRRNICALGVDTLSIDTGNSATFAAHKILNGAERYGIENLANLHLLPPMGAHIVVGVTPFKKGSGGPARVLATW